ncbi:hypothetical protein BGW38_005655, partial [Lunasporangiospora selenospora]
KPITQQEFYHHAKFSESPQNSPATIRRITIGPRGRVDFKRAGCGTIGRKITRKA